MDVHAAQRRRFRHGVSGVDFIALREQVLAAGEEFEQLVAERVEKIKQAHPERGDKPIPSDLVTVSGSGLDPDISPAAAEYQVERLAKNTGKSTSEIRDIIDACTEQPVFGVLGDARVNVLKVNLMLDGVLS